jgi:hypothetical protein
MFEKLSNSFGFEILTAVSMESSVFWDITQCSPAKVNRRFWGIYRFHIQGRIVKQAKKKQLYVCVLFGLFFCPEVGGSTFHWKPLWLSLDYMLLTTEQKKSSMQLLLGLFFFSKMQNISLTSLWNLYLACGLMAIMNDTLCFDKP